MKKILTLFVMLTLAVAVFAGEKIKTVFTLDHQMSENCEKKIKTNLRHEKGVSAIDVSLKANTITITFDKDKTDDAKLLDAFKKIGFNAMVVTDGSAHQGTNQGCCGNAGGKCGHNQKEGACCKKDASQAGCCKKASSQAGCCQEKKQADCCNKKK